MSPNTELLTDMKGTTTPTVEYDGVKLLFPVVNIESNIHMENRWVSMDDDRIGYKFDHKNNLKLVKESVHDGYTVIVDGGEMLAEQLSEPKFEVPLRICVNGNKWYTDFLPNESEVTVDYQIEASVKGYVSEFERPSHDPSNLETAMIEELQ